MIKARPGWALIKQDALNVGKTIKMVRSGIVMSVGTDEFVNLDKESWKEPSEEDKIEVGSRVVYVFENKHHYFVDNSELSDVYIDVWNIVAIVKGK